ncbi:MAG: hypothetical protein V2I33_22540 [Kangiellaceae bacterium]|nr:hypothetical protein [Kangiellaceae bacterium]
MTILIFFSQAQGGKSINAVIEELPEGEARAYPNDDNRVLDDIIREEAEDAEYQIT